MGWVFLLLSWVIPVNADTPCADLEKAWRSKYTVDFKVTWNLKGFQCPGGESTVAQAFWDLEHLQFPRNPDGSRTDFYAIVYSRIDNLARDNSDKEDYAYTANRTLTVTPPFYADERWDRASTLVHEARHVDSNDPRHVFCARGPYKGVAQGCDQTFWDGQWKGSGFNADLVFFSWLRTARNYNELKQEVVQSDINAIIPDRFNQITAEQIKRWRK